MPANIACFDLPVSVVCFTSGAWAQRSLSTSSFSHPSLPTGASVTVWYISSVSPAHTCSSSSTQSPTCTSSAGAPARLSQSMRSSFLRLFHNPNSPSPPHHTPTPSPFSLVPSPFLLTLLPLPPLPSTSPPSTFSPPLHPLPSPFPPRTRVQFPSILKK